MSYHVPHIWIWEHSKQLETIFSFLFFLKLDHRLSQLLFLLYDLALGGREGRIFWKRYWKELLLSSLLIHVKKMISCSSFFLINGESNRHKAACDLFPYCLFPNTQHSGTWEHFASEKGPRGLHHTRLQCNAQCAPHCAKTWYQVLNEDYFFSVDTVKTNTK